MHCVYIPSLYQHIPHSILTWYTPLNAFFYPTPCHNMLCSFRKNKGKPKVVCMRWPIQLEILLLSFSCAKLCFSGSHRAWGQNLSPEAPWVLPIFLVNPIGRQMGLHSACSWKQGGGRVFQAPLCFAAQSWWVCHRWASHGALSKTDPGEHRAPCSRVIEDRDSCTNETQWDRSIYTYIYIYIYLMCACMYVDICQKMFERHKEETIPCAGCKGTHQSAGYTCGNPFCLCCALGSSLLFLKGHSINLINLL